MNYSYLLALDITVFLLTDILNSVFTILVSFRAFGPKRAILVPVCRLSKSDYQDSLFGHKPIRGLDLKEISHLGSWRNSVYNWAFKRADNYVQIGLLF